MNRLAVRARTDPAPDAAEFRVLAVDHGPDMAGLPDRILIAEGPSAKPLPEGQGAPTARRARSSRKASGWPRIGRSAAGGPAGSASGCSRGNAILSNIASLHAMAGPIIDTHVNTHARPQGALSLRGTAAPISRTSPGAAR